MEFKATSQNFSKVDSEITVLFSFADKVIPQENELDKTLDGQITKLKKNKDFKAEKGNAQILFGDQKILLIGLGKQKRFSREILREAIGSSIQTLINLPNTKISILVPKLPRLSAQDTAQILAETVHLASYEFTEFKTEKSKTTKLEIVTLVVSKADLGKTQKGIIMGDALGKATNLARDLGNHPGNSATPQHLANHALSLSKRYKGLKVKVLGKQEIKKEKMGALLAVAQGSDEEPKFIVLEYQKKKNAPLVILVGKGVTFDSGGISIKPSEKMEEMKNDMAGAAAVLGIMQAASELSLPLNLIGLIPATENLPSGKAIKPGDIITSRSGKTIEIINTDAEGRLILSDALDYAKGLRPDLVIDFATLTGAMIVALGFELIGSFATDKKLNDQMQRAAANTGEKIWPMPLEEEYQKLIKNGVADIRNISTSPYGGAITAALFLKNFVDYPWMHLDIAGPAIPQTPKSYRPKGASGVGVRLAIDFLLNYK